MNLRPDDKVKSCQKLESGLRLGQEGIHSCQIGPFCSPLFWTGDEVSQIQISKAMIVEKRKQLFQMLNDDHSDIACKHCQMVKRKSYKDVDFTKIGHIDFAPTTICNLRCSFCGYTDQNLFHEAKYDALSILKEFNAQDVEWDSAVDFNGGEPTLLANLNECLDYFVSRRIRIFLYTNAVKYSQTVYDRLVDGSIRWVCTSLDSGAPSTFLHMKKKDRFLQVLENLTRYAHAGSQGGGKLSVKYIFCDDNCGDDDLSGFTYAMLAIRPQQIWLTFDFNPLNNLAGDTQDFGNNDYSKHISAYVKMYGLMKKHGLTVGHFTNNHLATASRQGMVLLESVLNKINESERNGATDDSNLILNNFREKEKTECIQTAYFNTMPLRIKLPNQNPENWSLKGKRVVLAPACALTVGLLKLAQIGESRILGILDRDPVLQGKSIEGYPVHGYAMIADLAPDVILVVSSEQHQSDIINQIMTYEKDIGKIAVYKPSLFQGFGINSDDVRE
ncbi:MAG: radical SAM protein [Desulfatitalea sp.]|nr:radical SAM protein [Desulfatitalea sp.]